MKIVTQKRGERFRLIDANTGQVAQKKGKDIDKGGYKTKELAIKAATKVMK